MLRQLTSRRPVAALVPGLLLVLFAGSLARTQEPPARNGDEPLSIRYEMAVRSGAFAVQVEAQGIVEASERIALLETVPADRRELLGKVLGLDGPVESIALRLRPRQ